MDRYLLFLCWESRAESGPGAERGLAAASEVYNLLKEHHLTSSNLDGSTFPACTMAGTPGPTKWFFAVQGIHGNCQFSNAVWEEINVCHEREDSEETEQTSIDECLGAIQSFEDNESAGRDSSALTEVFDESAESIHLLTDQLPAPGRAMIDVILVSLDKDGPKLKEYLPAIGALKHMTEWHSAKITIATKEKKGWQKFADYLLASIVSPTDLGTVIDFEEIWRGKIQIYERKFASQVKFPEFCLKHSLNNSCNAMHESMSSGANRQSKKFSPISEVFHYYGPILRFLQMVAVSDVPHYLTSNIEFELNLTRNHLKEKSKLLLDQLLSLHGKVAALFILPCNVSSSYFPSSNQLSTKKWKEYIARKPKVINVPDGDLKGDTETCYYYFLVQSNGRKACKASMIHSANRINGFAALTMATRRLKEKCDLEETGDMATDVIDSFPCFNGEQILQSERHLAQAQTRVLEEFLRTQESTKNIPSIAIGSLKALLTMTREQLIDVFNIGNIQQLKEADNVNLNKVTTESDGIKSNPLEWPERCILHNMEHFEKVKRKTRAAILTGSSEQLLGRKDSQRETMTLLDAKELLKYFTPQGQPSGELQPLQVQRGENAFLLTPELTPRKVKKLTFEKATVCHYHGLEYCLDNRRALERDLGFVELQSRLIRYETQTTCTRECCLVPSVLSPLPSPAVMSEPGSVPDCESMQGDARTDNRLKRRSKELDGLLPPNKRLPKSESTDSLMSLSSTSSGHHHTAVPLRPRSERCAAIITKSGQPPSAQTQKEMVVDKQASKRKVTESEVSKQAKESRSQKHTRMLKEVVTQTLKKHGIDEDNKCFAACCQRLFEISKFYLKDLKTSRGLYDEMKKAAGNNVKQVIRWELEKSNKN